MRTRRLRWRPGEPDLRQRGCTRHAQQLFLSTAGRRSMRTGIQSGESVVDAQALGVESSRSPQAS